MSNYIMADLSGLRRVEKNLRECYENESDIITSLKKMMGNLGDDWTGEAASAFFVKFKSKNVSIDQFLDEVENYADLIDFVCTTLEDTDTKLCSII